MALNSYVCTLAKEQQEALKALLLSRGWELGTQAYAHWSAAHDKTKVVAYVSGKLTVQGKGTEDFVRFILEPEILGEARLDYAAELVQTEDPRQFEPHAGIDESGKGDFFGPLCVACVYTDEAIARRLIKAGVTDSKSISSSRKMLELAELIRREASGRYSLVVVDPEAYNRLYAKFGNLNRLLAWGHAKALEELLGRCPDCPRALSDQFAQSKETVERALQERGRRIVFEQRTKAEADIAVAAASILARAEFVVRMRELGESAIGRELPRGVSSQVLETAREMVAKLGGEQLHRYAKMHFKTAAEVLG